MTSLTTGLAVLLLAATTLATLVGPRPHSLAGAIPGIRSASTQPPHAPATDSTRALSQQNPSIDTRSITRLIQAELAPLRGNYGVAVIDLATGTSYGVNSGSSFRAASVNKLPILIELYRRAVDGRINLDQTLTIADDDIQHYGTGIIQDPDADRTYSLRELAALMIETSDNTAAFVLERLLSEEAIQASVNRWGLRQTSMAANTTTPADMAALLASLKRNQLLPAMTTETVLAVLEHTFFTDRLQAGVPVGVPVAHKVGSDVAIFNDAGLVLLPGRPYTVVVLSQNADESEAEQAITRISGEIYDFQASLASTSSP